MPAYASGRNLIDAQWRKMTGLDFSEDGSRLFFEYAGHDLYHTLANGYVYGWFVNPTGQSTSYYY
jgi:hypothetical protein